MPWNRKTRERKGERAIDDRRVGGKEERSGGRVLVGRELRRVTDKRNREREMSGEELFTAEREKRRRGSGEKGRESTRG